MKSKSDILRDIVAYIDYSFNDMKFNQHSDVTWEHVMFNIGCYVSDRCEEIKKVLDEKD